MLIGEWAGGLWRRRRGLSLFVSTLTTDLHENLSTVVKKSPRAPKIGFLFTGQGAQWPRMAKAIVDAVPWVYFTLEDLDKVLQS